MGSSVSHKNEVSENFSALAYETNQSTVLWGKKKKERTCSTMLQVHFLHHTHSLSIVGWAAPPHGLANQLYSASSTIW